MMVTNFILISLALILIWIALTFVHRCYPVEPVLAGDNVAIYVDGWYNRTAQVSHIYKGVIVIYDNLPLPVHYRGKFYSVGFMEDGHSIMFIKRRKLFFLASIAELIRKIASTPEFDNSLSEELEVVGQSENEEESNG